MELSSWLRGLGLEQYEVAFRENAIDEKVLIRLTAEDLKELGVVAVGHRRMLLDAIAGLRGGTELKAEAPADVAPAKTPDSAALRAWPTDSAERRQVTVMFADLVGSTALAARMDPEDLREVVAAYHKCAAGIVRRFGGFVSQYLGDGMLAYFGYPQAHEDDAERAVRASVELVAAVAALKTRVPLQTRVGIATGLVVVGDVIDAGGSQERGIIGETPNLAARLQGIAEPNMVVVAESTRKLLGNLFELKDQGTRELKGIATPVPVWAVLRGASVVSRFEALHATDLSPFVGREHELEMLERRLGSARSQLCAIDIAAEPGMGKSRLLREFRCRIGKERAVVLSGSCSPDGQQTPFLPFIEVVRGSFQVSVGEAERAIAQKLEVGLTAVGLNSPQNLGLLLHLLGLNVPSGALTGLDGALIGLRTRDLLQQLLEARCRLSPVVMVIEDLHWIDTVSEELLGKIIGSDAKLRLLLLFTRRPEYLPPWRDPIVVTKLHLDPLPVGDIRRLVQARLGGQALPEAVVRQVAEKAEGNPLFAEEIVTYLTERDVLRATGVKADFDTNAVTTALPGSVQSLLTARVDRLASKDRALLQAASVIGRRFNMELLAAVVDGINDIDSRLRAMQALDLIRSEGKSGNYLFKHALVRDALYQSLLTEARKGLHYTIAEEIERRSGNRLIEVAETLAHHYSLTDHADKAFTYLSMAGSRSLSVYSLDEAEAHLTAAIALVEANPDCASDQQIANVLVDYTLLENALGKLRNVVEVPDRFVERLRKLGDCTQIVLIVHQKVFGLCFMTKFETALAEQTNITRMAERLGDDRSRAYAYASEILVSSAVAPKTPEEQEQVVRNALDAASKTEDSYIRSVVRWVIAIDEVSRGRMDVAQRIAEEMSAIGRNLNDPRPIGMGMGILGWIALTGDDYEKALNCANECLRIAYTPQEQMNALGVRGAALALMRRLGEAQTELSHIRMKLIELNWRYELLLTEPAFGILTILSGRVARGIRIIEDAVEAAHHNRWHVAEDWAKLFLCEVYLDVMFSKDRPPLTFLLRNLPILIKILFAGRSLVETLVSQIQRNPQFDRNGHHIARTNMILGFLYKGKKNRALAVGHLTEAKRILSQFGYTPILTRVDVALTELGP
jgi:class 3 adenylate cyclase/tetratricopeptide (TPR) repeat protein